MQYWNGSQWVVVPAGTNGKVLTFQYGIPQWGNPPIPCGTSITVSHIAGAVAPVTKTVTYSVVKNIPGEPSKCWITSNLGADHQATAVNDATEASAVWYWQFNCKQGFKHDGTTRTPNTTWITTINENSDWLWTNDPCAIELGNCWRIPTSSEWNNVIVAGGWTNWNGPWNSALKLHANGYLNVGDGVLFVRSVKGYYWSTTQINSLYSMVMAFHSAVISIYSHEKAFGFSARCIRDY